MEPPANVVAPKRCAECGGVSVFGELESRHGWRPYVGDPPVRHTVKRYDMPDKVFPIVVNVCTVCGHISLYAAYPPPGDR